MKKIFKHLRKPLPELFVFITDKIVSFVWRFYIKEVGKGFFVASGCRIKGGDAITIGEHFHTGINLWLDAVDKHIEFNYSPKIVIGNWVSTSDNVHIAATSGITIGDGVLIGSNVHITDHSHGVYTGNDQDAPDLLPPVFRKLAEGKKVEIGDNVWLGDGVVVLPGVTIGNGSIIGSNSVVAKDIPANVIAVGSPAKPIKKYDAKSNSWNKIIEN